MTFSEGLDYNNNVMNTQALGTAGEERLGHYKTRRKEDKAIMEEAKEELKEETIEEPTEETTPVMVEKGEVSDEQMGEIKGGEFTTITEIATKLGYSRQWITVLVQGGYIQGIKPLGGQWRIPRSELDRLLKEGIPPLPREQPKPKVTEIPVDERIAEKVVEREEKKPPPSMFPFDFGQLFGGGKK